MHIFGRSRLCSVRDKAKCNAVFSRTCVYTFDLFPTKQFSVKTKQFSICAKCSHCGLKTHL